MTLSLAPHGVDAHLPEALDVRRDEAPLEAALGGPAPVEHRHLDEAELLPEGPGVDGEEVEVGSAGTAGGIHEAAAAARAAAGRPPLPPPPPPAGRGPGGPRSRARRSRRDRRRGSLCPPSARARRWRGRSRRPSPGRRCAPPG